MTRPTRIFVILLAVMVAALGAFGAYVLRDVTRGGERGEAVRIVVPDGASFTSVTKQLVEKGLVQRAWTLTFFARATRSDRVIHKGTYEFQRGTPSIDILRALADGDILAVEITVPEGFNTWQVSGAVRAAGIDSLTMLQAVRDPELLRALGVPAATLEGYLFPDTYKIPFGSDARDVVAQMLTRFHSVWTPRMERRASEIGMTRHQVMTLASIIEAEARVDDERPRVSAVYHNRLAQGIKLDADPTVAYAMGGYRGRLYYKDLEIKSPYNTYRNRGLPPGPICNPGESSIRAALHPDPGLKAIFFVARGDGRHVFSNTLREHDAAIRQIRRERAAANQ